MSNRLTHLDVFPFSFNISNSELPHLPKAESLDKCGDSEYLFGFVVYESVLISIK